MFQSGIKVVHNEKEVTLHGNVLVLLADTLAAHDLGGFKVGVGFALRKCRVCMATNTDIQTKVNANSWCMKQAFPSFFSLLKNNSPCGPLLLMTITAQCLIYDSVTCGINKCSPLNELKSFHVANGQLPQDIMHIIFEGVLPLNIRLMLNKFVCEDKFITLMVELLTSHMAGMRSKTNLRSVWIWFT